MRYTFLSREDKPTQWVDKYSVVDSDGQGKPMSYERVVPKRLGKTLRDRKGVK